MPASQLSVAFGGCAANSVGYVLTVLICVAPLGCNTIRQKVSQRCENCNSLCKQACAAKDDGYPDQADLLLNEAIRQRPMEIETRRQLAESLWECGRRNDAVAEYKHLIQTYPNDIRLQERLAVMYWTLGNKSEAAEFADASLRLSPSCVDALLVKARTQAARKDFDAAAATYIRLTTLAPEMTDAKLELAEIHMQRGHAIQACTVLRDVMVQSELSPVQQAETEWNLGLAYAAANRWAESANHLGHAMEQREISSVDWQFVILAKTMAGQDTAGFHTLATLASNKQPAKPENSPWTSLRDQLMQPGRFTDVAPSDEILRADFRRTAQAEGTETADTRRR